MIVKSWLFKRQFYLKFTVYIGDVSYSKQLAILSSDKRVFREYQPMGSTAQNLCLLTIIY